MHSIDEARCDVSDYVDVPGSVVAYHVRSKYIHNPEHSCARFLVCVSLDGKHTLHCIMLSNRDLGVEVHDVPCAQPPSRVPSRVVGSPGGST